MQQPARLSFGLAALCLLALTACGGSGGSGGSGGASGSVLSADLAGDPTYEARVSLTFGAGSPTSNGLVGDISDDDTVRAFYSFDLPALPAGTVVISAILKLYQITVFGTPFTDLGAIEVSHMDLGVDTDTPDFDRPGLIDDLGDLATSPATGYHQLDVTQAVQDDLDMLRGRSQFRLRFETLTDLDGVGDNVLFEQSTGNPSDADVPLLEVTYRLP